MPKKLPKKEGEQKIREFFLDIKDKAPKQVKKIKKLAMRNNIKLGDLRKTFCKKCFTPYITPRIRIRKGIKSVICKECGYVVRWKMK